jgi:predicted adenylyl cyclase CyaB
MIEVEKKFLLSKEAEKKLIDGAEFIGEKIFTDIYYDNANFDLTANDKWLRVRADRWELKLPLNKIAAERVGDLYDEIENEEEIRKILNIDDYQPFCTCKTIRRKYKKDGFGIDIDFVDYNDDFTYELAEIELMVQDKSEMDVTIKKIIEFATENGLEVKYVRGKIIEYLRRKKPDHFQALVNSGVVRPDQV